MSSRPGVNSRGRGDKRKNFRRGGGHKFSRVQVLNADGEEVSPWAEDAIHGSGSSAEDSGSDSDSSASAGPAFVGEEHPGPQLGKPRSLTKKERQEAAKQKQAAKAPEPGDLPSGSGGEDAEKGSSSGDSEDDALAKKMNSLAVDKKKKVQLKQQAAQAAQAQQHDQELERLRKIREEREMKQAYLEAEKEEIKEKNAQREAKTKALLEKAERNKAGANKKKRGGKT